MTRSGRPIRMPPSMMRSDECAANLHAAIRRRGAGPGALPWPCFTPRDRRGSYPISARLVNERSAAERARRPTVAGESEGLGPSGRSRAFAGEGCLGAMSSPSRRTLGPSTRSGPGSRRGRRGSPDRGDRRAPGHPASRLHGPARRRSRSRTGSAAVAGGPIAASSSKTSLGYWRSSTGRACQSSR